MIGLIPVDVQGKLITVMRLRNTAGFGELGIAQEASLSLLLRSCALGALLALPIQAQTLRDPNTIDDCRYKDVGAAQGAWQPMAGTAPVLTSAVEGQAALELRCNFVGAKTERASWDKQVKLDLSAGHGIQFKIRCADASPVSYFSLYFQSGAGWYHASFYPESSTDWNTITILKSETSVEGKPDGWGQIQTIRLSAWRGRDADTEFFVADLRQVGVLGADAPVAILRDESAARISREEAGSVERYSEMVARQFQDLDIGCAQVSDLDASVAPLRRARLVVLPYDPSLTERAEAELIQYVRGGGKVLAFYHVPARLQPELGIGDEKHVKAARPGAFSALRVKSNLLPGAPALVGQQSWNIDAYQPLAGAGEALAEWLDEKGDPTGYPAIVGTTNCVVMTHVLLGDDAVNKRRLLLAMAGRLAPELWRLAAEAQLARLGTIGKFKTFEQATEQIGRLNPGKAAVSNALAEACELRRSAWQLNTQRQFGESMTQAAAASQRLMEAFCLAQQPLQNEFRAFWCHSASGVSGIDWDEAVSRLAQYGFTAILPNMLWGGAAFYPSRVLPVIGREDQIALCLAACRKHGLQLHVWKVNWNLGSAAPREFVESLRQQGRLQADSQGREALWLCPSHPANQKLEVDSLIEVVRNYAIDGLHFDYIRYPDSDHCFCAGCRERFQRATGATLTHWPSDVLDKGQWRERWLDWRRGNITAVVKTVSEQARAINPKLRLSAAVFANWPRDRDDVGQDWKLWCAKGYLDFVCPMDYTPSNRSFENQAAQQIQWAKPVPCYPGIGVSASTSPFGVDRVIEEIQTTRRLAAGGFVIFNYGAPESKELLPMLGMGITARK